MKYSFNEALNVYRSKEGYHIILALQSGEKPRNDALVSFLLSWENTSVKIKGAPDIFESLPSMEDLWAFCEFDFSQGVVASGLDTVMYENMFYQAKSLKLIYPDGSISPAIKQALIALAVEFLSSKSKKSSQKSSG